MILRLPSFPRLPSSGCGSVLLENPEFDIVSLADRQTIQNDLTDQTKNVWRAVVHQFPLKIELIGGVGDAAHAKRTSCHNVIKNAQGQIIEKAKALDIQPIGAVGSAEFIALGTRIADWLWANRVEFGITVQIWQGRIRSIYKQNGAWRPYFGLNRHNKHIHISVGCNG